MTRQTAPAGTALVIVDMFNLFDFPGGRALAQQALAITPALAALRQRFDDAGAPVIHANDHFCQWQGALPELVEQCRRQGGTSWRIARQLLPSPHHHQILKPRHSALRDTALEALLRQRHINAVVIAGVAGDSCVLATAQDANMLGHRVWVPSDTMATRTALLKRSTLALLRHSLKVCVRSSVSCTSLFPRD